MTRDDDRGGHRPDGARPDVDPHNDVDSDDLDPTLQAVFSRAFVDELPVDVGARHLWLLYRSARPVEVDGLAAGPRTTPLGRLAASTCLALLVLLLPGLLGQLSANALPGDPLYPVKRQNEQMEVSQAVSWAQRDQVLLEQAERRLYEAQAVAGRRPARVAAAVSDVQTIIDQLEASPVASTRLQTETIRGDVARRLAALVDTVDAPSRDSLLVAIDKVTGEGRSAGDSGELVARSEGGADGDVPARSEEEVAGGPAPGASPQESSSIEETNSDETERLALRDPTEPRTPMTDDKTSPSASGTGEVAAASSAPPAASTIVPSTGTAEQPVECVTGTGVSSAAGDDDGGDTSTTTSSPSAGSGSEAGTVASPTDALPTLPEEEETPSGAPCTVPSEEPAPGPSTSTPAPEPSERPTASEAPGSTPSADSDPTTSPIASPTADPTTEAVIGDGETVTPSPPRPSRSATTRALADPTTSVRPAPSPPEDTAPADDMSSVLESATSRGESG